MPWTIHLEIETTQEHLEHIERSLQQWLSTLEESQSVAQRLERCWDAPRARHRAVALRSALRELIVLVDEMSVWHRRALSEYNQWLAMDEREWGYISKSLWLNRFESLINLLSHAKNIKDVLELVKDLRNLDELLYSTFYLSRLSILRMQIDEIFLKYSDESIYFFHRTIENTIAITETVEIKHLKGPMTLLFENIDEIIPSKIDILLTFSAEFLQEVPENWAEYDHDILRTVISSTIEGTIQTIPALGIEVVGAGVGAGIGALIGAGIGSLFLGVGAAPGAVAGAKIGSFVGGIVVGLNEEWIRAQNIGGVSIDEWFEEFERLGEHHSDKLTELIAQSIESVPPHDWAASASPVALLVGLNEGWTLTQNIGGVSIGEWFEGFQEFGEPLSDNLAKPITQTIESTMNYATKEVGDIWQTFSDIL